MAEALMASLIPNDLRRRSIRWLRASKRRLQWREHHPRPHFLGVGTQKGGTTTLYQLLKHHPEIYLPDNKEVHYFTKHYDRGEPWYREQFADAPAGCLRGEITPYYLFHAAVPERIQALRRTMKIIVLLRDPVERTLSQYFHSCRWSLETLPLDEALAAEGARLEGALELIQQPGGTHLSYQEHSYVARSRYDEQLPRYFQRFGRHNVLVLRSEDLFQGDPKLLEAIEAFLSIAPFPRQTLIPRANPGEGEAQLVPPAVREHLKQTLAPTYRWLERELGMHW